MMANAAYPQNVVTPISAYDPYNPSSNQRMGMMPRKPIPQQPVAGAQPQFGGMTYVFTPNPLADLHNINSALIKQQPEYLEAITGCETPNRYHVFGLTQSGYTYLFKCSERSGWFMRNCFPSSARSFDMEIKHIASLGQFDPSFSKNYATANRPFTCTFFCLNRPEMRVSLTDNGQCIGKIINPFTFFDPEFEVYNQNGQLRYFVSASCCQCGLLCANNFFGKMSEVTFPIYNQRGGGQVGSIVKKSAQLQELITDADSYNVNFPSDATPEEKLLLICLGLFIDYIYFEVSPSDDDRKRYNRGYNSGYNRGYYH